MTKKQRTEIILATLKKLYPSVGTFLDSSNDHEFLFAVILSAQTTDKKVNEITPRLFNKYKTLADYAKAKPEDIATYISQINYYRNKSKFIVGAAQKLIETFDSKIPKTIAELILLPGVGRKTANVVLNNVHNIAEGIAVDTHVIRLATNHGLTKHTDPQKIEQDLMKLLPQEEWFLFTKRAISYGRDYCPATKHDHDKCPLNLAIFKKQV